MLKTRFPYDWYWRADDGRIYSSATQGNVLDTDPRYVEFLKSGLPTVWPRDDSGAQSVAALQDVLSRYGLFADLTAYAADCRWRRETGGIEVDGVRIATDDRSKMLILGARSKADNDSTFTTPWEGSDGTTYPLGAAQIVAISDAVASHVNDCFVRFSNVKTGLANGTITSREQVDAAFA